MFKKILIANRGEIACRIIRTAKGMGVATVVVFSEPDASALHVEMADEAYCIGPAAATRSYLNRRAILEAAKQSGAEAIHPGYGFLSENPEFAADCEAAGLVFIGPPPEVITAMGVKSRAREIMEEAGIPVIPGRILDSPAAAEQVAETIGYPLLVKANRGGGGKGIRLVRSPGELEEAIEAAGRESAAAFGDAGLLLERLVEEARHVEVQIFRDSFGHALHLFERDCSLQRRHQKIIEEAPAPGIPEQLRRRLHAAAVAAAGAAGYLGAGTVEFLVEPGGDFYFLEINTRLQVEHPVTEMLTGQDLVAWQLLVAAGEPLPLRQADLSCRGHAIEARIYAEDPQRDFLPSTGTIGYLREPESRDARVRIDGGVRVGDTVTPHYDPILAKLIVHGRDREEAVGLLRAGLEGYKLAGPATNIDFLRWLVDDPAFLSAGHSTRHVDRRLTEVAGPRPFSGEALALAALWRLLDNRRREQERTARTADPHSPWSSGAAFRLNLPAMFDALFAWHDGTATVRVMLQPDGYHLTVGEEVFLANVAELTGEELRCRLNGRNLAVTVVEQEEILTLFHGGRTIRLRLPDPGRAAEEGSGSANLLRAPIPGNITKVMVDAGDRLRQGDPLLVLEAMKMEYVIRAPADGTVKAVLFAQGDTVREKDRLAEFEPAGEVDDGTA